MISLTYGVLPKFEEFEVAFNNVCPDGYLTRLNSTDQALMEWANAPCSSLCAMDVDDTWATVVMLTRCWESDDPYAGEYAGNMASCILETLGFEWI